MSFEFETKLCDGRTVYVVGEAEVEERCDCFDQGDFHPHIMSLELDSVMDVDSNLEVDLSARDRADLEGEISDRLYREVKEGVA